MSTIEININDYLSEEEKKEICISEFQKAAKETTKKDFERVLSNIGYDFLLKEINKHFNDDMEKFIIENTIRIINEISEYSVFKKPNAWDREPSKGWLILQNSLAENKDLINKKVLDHIENLDKDLLRESFDNYITDAIISKIKS